MAPTADQAVYIGPAGSVLPDGTQSGSELVPHETVCDVPLGEAEASSYWEPVTVKKVPARKRKRATRAKAPAAADVGAQRVVPSESAGTQTGAGAPSKPAEDGDS